MASQFSGLKPKTRLAWQLAWPLGLVLILAIGWSIYWQVAAGKIMATIDQSLEREKINGLAVSCANKNISGFPFKFLLTCNKLNVVKQTPAGLTNLTALRFVAVIQAYNFNHLISEFYGPYEVRQVTQNNPDAVSRQIFYGNAGSITSSLILKNQVLKETTLVIRKLEGILVEHENPKGPQKIATDLLEAIVHLRSTEDLSKTTGPYEITAALKNLFLVGGSANIQSEKGTRFESFKAAMNITNAPYRVIANAVDWLKVWKANGGDARITHVSANSGPVKLTGTGQFKLDNHGRAEGVLNTKMSGLDNLIRGLVANGRIREKDATLGLAAINLLGGANAGGVKVSLRAQKGQLYFGPFKIGDLKPLFAP